MAGSSNNNVKTFINKSIYVVLDGVLIALVTADRYSDIERSYNRQATSIHNEHLVKLLSQVSTRWIVVRLV